MSERFFQHSRERVLATSGLCNERRHACIGSARRSPARRVRLLCEARAEQGEPDARGVMGGQVSSSGLDAGDVGLIDLSIISG